ncbi:hypothetical protein ACFW04_000519 [Cataglyphis niger]
MGSQRIIRAFLFLMVIQLHCEILLAENSKKLSKSDLSRIFPGTSKYLDGDYDVNIIDDLDYRASYLDDFDHSHVIRNPINSDSRVIEMPARKSISSDSEYEANLRQLSDRKMRYPDSDPHVTKVPARKSLSSNRNSNYLELYSQPSSLDLSGTIPQSQRRSLGFVIPRPKTYSKLILSDLEDTIDRTESSETQSLHPEAADETDQISARILQAAQGSSKPSLRTYPDTNYVQQTRRFDLKPALKFAQLGVKGMSLLPEIVFGELPSNKQYNEFQHYDFRRAVCPNGTQLVNNRCELISFENRADTTIEKNDDKSDNFNSNRFK